VKALKSLIQPKKKQRYVFRVELAKVGTQETFVVAYGTAFDLREACVAACGKYPNEQLHAKTAVLLGEAVFD
jgi:hypothetical protein